MKCSLCYLIVTLLAAYLTFTSCENDPIEKTKTLFKDKIVYKKKIIEKDKIVYRDKKREKKQPFLALSMEGGGIRGLMQARFLELLEEELARQGQPKIYEIFDLFAGASIGGVHALMFAVKESSAKHLVEFYTQELFSRIFKKSEEKNPLYAATTKLAYDSVLRRFASTYNISLPSFEDLPSLITIRYDKTEKLEVLKEVFGDLRLSDAKKEFIIPAYRIDSRNTTYYFSSINSISSNKNIKDTGPILAADIADATSAAPAFFPIKEITIGDELHQFMDGVVFENNISSTIIDIALKEDFLYTEIKILSLGTGETNILADKKINELRNAGMLPLLGTGQMAERVVEAPAKKSIYNAKWRIKDNFIHIPFFSEEINIKNIDDYSDSNLELLRRVAEEAWKENKEKILKLLISPESSTPHEKNSMNKKQNESKHLKV